MWRLPGTNDNPQAPAGRTPSRLRFNRRSTVWLVATVLLLGIFTGTLLWFRHYFWSVVEVPSVVGMAAEDARLILEEKGLGYYVLQEVYSEEEAGTVLEQDPKPTSIRKSGVGEQVGVVLSKGRELVQVPDIRGQTRLGPKQYYPSTTWPGHSTARI